MALESGVVKFFNNKPDKLYGFLSTAKGDVFFHYNNGCGVMPGQHPIAEPTLISGDLDIAMPMKGDRLVFERGMGKKGPKADNWAFEEDYLQAKVSRGVPSDEFSFDELASVVGGIFGLKENIIGATEVLSLNNRQVAIFLRNTPDGKKGEELWKEFRRRQAEKGEDEYTFITFVREVLSAACHPVNFTPDEVTGYCPVCHQEHLLKAVDPEYPDDPMLREEDFFKLAAHRNPQGSPCDGEDKHPTGMANAEDYSDDAGFAGSPLDQMLSREY